MNRTSIPGDLNDAEDPSGSSHITHHQDVQNPELSPLHRTTSLLPLPHGRASRRASQIPELADLFAALGSSPVATTSNATIGTGNEDTSPVASTANAIIETDHEDNPGDEPLRPTVDPSADNQLRVENFFRDLEDVLHLMNPAHPSVPRTLADHEIQALLDELETTTIGRYLITLTAKQQDARYVSRMMQKVMCYSFFDVMPHTISTENACK
ncbi:hypothetical protein H4Q26_012866 [Puccinia striiformis f. sp. tritici PST-130]|nr:hypothetical protein H4Q26_012866 [Puccinia striiformis f. sp. tritici PST-130]